MHYERFRGLAFGSRFDFPAAHIEALPPRNCNTIAGRFLEMAKASVSTPRNYAGAQPKVKVDSDGVVEEYGASDGAKSSGFIAPAVLSGLFPGFSGRYEPADSA